MDYGTFKTWVSSYLHRTDLAAVPGLYELFIEAGRMRLTDQLRVPEMEQVATVTLTAGVGALSSDLVEIRAVKGSRVELLSAPLPQVLEATSESVYAVSGLDLYAPGCGSATVHYYERPQTLVGAADSATRTVLTVYAHLWLYATLAEAYLYLDDPDGEARYQARLDEEVRRANARAARARHAKAAASDIRRNVTAAGAGL